VFSVPEEPSANRYGDIFFIEPGSHKAKRAGQIRDRELRARSERSIDRRNGEPDL